VLREIGVFIRVLRGLVVLYGTAFVRAKYLIFIEEKLLASGARTSVPLRPLMAEGAVVVTAQEPTSAPVWW